MASTANQPLDKLSKTDNNGVDLSTRGMIITLALNLGAFVCILAFFEYYRNYKQIFLKRLQRRFIAAGRVPKAPPQLILGWLVRIMQVTELDVLHMVGLDGYIYLRFQAICLKFCVFASITGILILLPTYSTLDTPSINWDKYTLMNVLSSTDETDASPKYRLWLTAVFGYIYTVYFCQLLYAEYNNFSLQRLHYLAQADLSAGNAKDPDTLPQKFYTVMLERIPAHLRSAEKLYEYFEELFPGEVFTVEVALDLRELNGLISQRKGIRNRLEQAIADFIATGSRPWVDVKKGTVKLADGTEVMPLPLDMDARTWFGYLQESIFPESYGYEKRDALEYYTKKLIELNKRTKETQEKCFERSRTTNQDIQRRLKNKYDTRAAAAVERIAKQGTKLIQQVSSDQGIEALLFGTGGEREARQVKDGEEIFDRGLFALFDEWKIRSGDDDSRKEHGAAAAVAPAAGGGDGKQGKGPLSSNIKPFQHQQQQQQQHTSKDHQQPPPQRAGGKIAPWERQSDDSLASLNLEVAEINRARNPYMERNPYREGTEAAAKWDRKDADSATPSDVDSHTTSENEGATGMGTGTGTAPGAVGKIDITGALLSALVESSGDRGLPLDAPSATHQPPPPPPPPLPPPSTSLPEETDASHPRKRVSLAVDGDDRVPSPYYVADSPSPSTAADAEQRQRAHIQALAASDRIDQMVWGRGAADDSSRGDAYPLPPSAATHSVQSIKAAMTGRRSDPPPPVPLEAATPAEAEGLLLRRSSLLLESARLDEATRIPGTESPAPADNTDRRGRRGKGSFLGPTHRAGPLGSGGVDGAQIFGADFAEKAKTAGHEAWEQSKIAGIGALRGVLEMERAFEMLTVGAYYKFSSTAFVTFKTRMAETIAHQMLLTNDAMEVSHAPNPNDIIWENVAIPKSQVTMRNFMMNVGLVIGSVFWSTLVTAVNNWVSTFEFLPKDQRHLLEVCVLLMFLLALPFIFDAMARNYEGMKLESEIQNSIMTRYYYYQLINIYVTVGLNGVQIVDQLLAILRVPETIVSLLGRTIPMVSIYFLNLIIVKVFAAVPIEMCRPWQWSTILSLGYCLDRRKVTRRALRTGVFYAWPMLYGWVYPQLLVVLMVVLTYSWVAPLLMPFGVLFYAFAYLMYKYQLLYVYINNDQSGGFMWYAVFNRSLIALLFASFTLLALLGLKIDKPYARGPFFFLLPMPFGILYFWHYCDVKFKKTSLNLSFGLAKQIDHYNASRKEAGQPVPQESFKKHLFRQPTLTEPPQYPEPYRKVGEYGSYFEGRRGGAPEGGAGGDDGADVDEEGDVDPPLSADTDRVAWAAAMSTLSSPTAKRGDSSARDNGGGGGGGGSERRLRSRSINPHALFDETEDDFATLESYFHDEVLRYAVPGRPGSVSFSYNNPAPAPGDSNNSNNSNNSNGVGGNEHAWPSQDNGETSTGAGAGAAGGGGTGSTRNPLHDPSRLV